MNRREILVLDYSAGNASGPHALSMYDCLSLKYNLTFVNVPVPRWMRLLARMTAFHPRRSEWSRRFWQKIEAYQHSPAGFSTATNDYSNAVRALLKKRCFDLILQYGALFGPVTLPQQQPYLTYHDGSMAITCRSASHQAAYLAGSDFEEWMKLEQRLVRGASRVLTYSHRTRHSYIQDYGCSEDRVFAVGSSDWVRRSDREWLQDRLALAPQQDNDSRERQMILFMHTDFSRKGGDVLLQAFHELLRDAPDARLVVVGPNPELAQGRNVHALGVVRDRKVLMQLYQKATVFVLPSLNDPFPRVIFEAMANGVPCVAARVGGIPEQVIDGQTGLLVEPGDAHALAQSMLRLLCNSDERRQFARAALQHLIENFLPESVASRVEEQIEAVCN